MEPEVGVVEVMQVTLVPGVMPGVEVIPVALVMLDLLPHLTV
jgi:hypothetical protein